MDTVGHALITSAAFDEPLVVVASAINLRYNRKGVGQLREVLPQEYSGLADGIESHLTGNAIVNVNPIFLSMKKESRRILIKNGIRDIFSEVAMEATVDHLLLEETDVAALVCQLWDRFDWDVAAEYAPLFSQDPERAKRNIAIVRQRLGNSNIGYVSLWLKQVVGVITGSRRELEPYKRTVVELADTLRCDKLYLLLIAQAQTEMKLRNNHPD